MTALPASLPRPRVVATLLAGRGTFRLAAYGSGLVLLALWGPEEFARYATAVGAVAWLAAVQAGGPEKAALALIPRPDGAALERFFLRLAVVPFAVLATGWLLLAVVAPAATATRYAAAAAVAGGIGCCGILVALYRLRGAPYLDAVAFVGAAAAYGVAVALVAVAGLTAEAVLAVLVGGMALIVAGLVLGLRRDRTDARPTRPAARAALRAASVLGAGGLLATLAVSVLYAMFAITGDAVQTSLFYVLMVFSSVLAVGWQYVLRLAQPPLVGWLLRVGAVGGWRLTRRVLGLALLAGVPVAAVLAVLGLLTGPSRWLAAVTVAVEVSLFTASTAAAVVLENIDAPGRRWSLTGAVAHFLAVVGTGWWLVPAAGALGAAGALLIGELCRALVLRGLVTRAISRGPELSTAGAPA